MRTIAEKIIFELLSEKEEIALAKSKAVNIVSEFHRKVLKFKDGSMLDLYNDELLSFHTSCLIKGKTK